MICTNIEVKSRESEKIFGCNIRFVHQIGHNHLNVPYGRNGKKSSTGPARGTVS